MSRKAPSRAARCSRGGPALPALLERLPWLALNVAHGAGWAAAHRLLGASRAVRSVVQAVLPHARKLLPGSLCLACRDSRLGLLDLRAGAWALHCSQPNQRDTFPNLHALLACDGHLLAVTDRGALLRLDRQRGAWEEAKCRIAGFDFSTRLVVAPSGRCYIVDGKLDGLTRIRQLDVPTGKVAELWRGLSARRRAIDIGVSRPLLVRDVLCWFTFDESGSCLVVSTFDLKTKRHAVLEPLVHPRISYVYCDQREIVVLGGSIYMLAHCDTEGSARPGAATSKVRMWRLRLDAGVWEAMPPAPTPRGCFGAAVVNGRLYVLGGESPELPKVLDVLERFDPATNAWEVLSPMPTPRSNPAVLVHDGRLYAIGGCGDCYSDDARFLWPSRVVEVYSTATGTWERLPSIPPALAGYAACNLPPAVLSM